MEVEGDGVIVRSVGCVIGCVGGEMGDGPGDSVGGAVVSFCRWVGGEGEGEGEGEGAEEGEEMVVVEVEKGVHGWWQCLIVKGQVKIICR